MGNCITLCALIFFLIVNVFHMKYLATIYLYQHNNVLMLIHTPISKTNFMKLGAGAVIHL